MWMGDCWGLLRMLAGGLVNGKFGIRRGCCGLEGCIGVRGVRSWLFEMYRSLSVRGCECM